MVTVEHTPIEGLLVVRLDVHRDTRGWFKENWQREAMTALGLPDFGPVQHNVAFNAVRGTTRGIHTEPWDKLVSVVTGRVFGAWVDMRRGAGFGTVVHLELDPSTAVFVPRGVGNAYQTLEDGTAYSYLVNDHFRAGTAYPAADLADPALAIPWPVPLADAIVSEKDRHNPALADVEPLEPRRALVLGARGQLGRALAAEFPDAVHVGRDELDITDPAALAAWPWREHDVVLNAAGYTAVDEAETESGRRAAWAANAVAPAVMARLADEHGFTLVHYSSDYVFDGTVEVHTEDEPPSPLGVYGQSKAAGDLAVAAVRRHYVVRTSWVVGEGANFVATMRSLADSGATPRVVDDQFGRLTSAAELARGTRHLLEVGAPYGTYNLSCDGPAASWADIAEAIFVARGRTAADVIRVSSADYAAGRALAPRPRHSVLNLTRIRSTGFVPLGHRGLWERDAQTTTRP
jgi:dTDP-4-dehydrorhamnose 3,5-epimerase